MPYNKIVKIDRTTQQEKKQAYSRRIALSFGEFEQIIQNNILFVKILIGYLINLFDILRVLEFLI